MNIRWPLQSLLELLRLVSFVCAGTRMNTSALTGLSFLGSMFDVVIVSIDWYRTNTCQQNMLEVLLD